MCSITQGVSPFKRERRSAASTVCQGRRIPGHFAHARVIAVVGSTGRLLRAAVAVLCARPLVADCGCCRGVVLRAVQPLYSKNAGGREDARQKISHGGCHCFAAAVHWRLMGTDK
jgi:hypothetical protein